MRLFVVILTHTDRHLAPTLHAVLTQAQPPAAVAVASDTADPAVPDAIARTLNAHAGPPPCPVLLSARPHQGASRQGQCRNNGVRALSARFGLRDEDGLVFLDGDVALGPEALAQHARLLASGHGLVLAHRAELDEPATARFIAHGDVAAAWPQDADAALARRATRYRRALAIAALGGRRLGLVKPHKPKVISCHFAVSAGPYLAINGFDEAYEGHGYEDDDFGRRLYRLRPPPRVAIAVGSIRAVHLWHPTRKVDNPAETPQGLRFARRDLPARAQWGYDNPRPQPEPSVTPFTPPAPHAPPAPSSPQGPPLPAGLGAM